MKRRQRHRTPAPEREQQDSARTATAARKRMSAKPGGAPSEWASVSAGRVSPPAPSLKQEEQGTPVGKIGIVFSQDGVNLRDKPLPGDESTVLRLLPFNTRLFVDKKLGGGWYFVTTDRGEQGYVVERSVKTNLPEPGAVLHRIESGESAIGIAERYYKPHAQKWGRDLRFYVNVLAFVNRGPGDRGIYRQRTDDSWRATLTRAGYLIWIPSVDFARTLVGKVRSGSITYEAWSKIKDIAYKIAEFVIGGLSFIAGVLRGAFESVIDLIRSLVDLGEMVWQLLKDIFTGTVLSKAKSLFQAVKELSWRDLADFFGGIFSDFQTRWNESGLVGRWHFRGRVIGYLLAEIAMMALSAGVLTGVKLAGKLAKAGKTLDKIAKLARKLPGVASLERGAKGAVKIQKAIRVKLAVKAAAGGKWLPAKIWGKARAKRRRTDGLWRAFRRQVRIRLRKSTRGATAEQIKRTIARVAARFRRVAGPATVSRYRRASLRGLWKVIVRRRLSLRRFIVRALMDSARRWREGKRAVEKRVHPLPNSKLTLDNLQRILRPLQKEFRYKKLYARYDSQEGDYDIYGAMSPDRKITEKKPKPPASVIHYKESARRPTQMVADPLSKVPQKGAPPGSPPIEPCVFWNKVGLIRTRSGKTSLYIRGHLLNHHVHGPGLWRNLTPLTRAANSEMARASEREVKQRVLKRRNAEVLRYDVNVSYPPAPVTNTPNRKLPGQPKKERVPEEGKLAQKVTMDVWKKEFTNGAWRRSRKLRSQTVRNVPPFP